jgi:hypothetical protein
VTTDLDKVPGLEFLDLLSRQLAMVQTRTRDRSAELRGYHVERAIDGFGVQPRKTVIERLERTQSAVGGSHV